MRPQYTCIHNKTTQKPEKLGFVYYKQGGKRLAAASDQVYQLLAYGLSGYSSFLHH